MANKQAFVQHRFNIELVKKWDIEAERKIQINVKPTYSVTQSGDQNFSFTGFKYCQLLGWDICVQNFKLWTDYHGYRFLTYSTVHQTKFINLPFTSLQRRDYKKLRNIIQACPVVQTFNFEVSQKLPTLVLRCLHFVCFRFCFVCILK